MCLLSDFRLAGCCSLSLGACRARRRIVPELAATAPPIPVWCYRVVAGAAEPWGQRRRRRAGNNALRGGPRPRVSSRERGTSGRWHIHCAIELPSHFDAIARRRRHPKTAPDSFGCHPPMDKDRNPASRKCQRESTPETPLCGPIAPASASATRQLMAPAPAARTRRRLLPNPPRAGASRSPRSRPPSSDLAASSARNHQKEIAGATAPLGCHPPMDEEHHRASCRGPYCVLSYEAVAQLRARGFKVRRLEDGLPEWRAAGLPVVVGSG